MTARRTSRARPAPGRLVRVVLFVGAVAGMLGLAPVPAAGAAPLPAGYRLVASETLGPGVEHQTLRRDDPVQDVHVARLAAGMAGRLVPVLGGNALGGAETTSSMCVRVGCVAAVNGDFSDAGGRPVGAMVSAGELLITPSIEHILMRIDSQGRATVRPGIDWSVGLTTADGRTVRAHAVNRPPAGDSITLYSRRWGAATPADPSATAVQLQLSPGTVAALPPGTSPVGVGAAWSGGNVPIAEDQVVLSGRGAGAQAVAELVARSAGAAVLQVDVGGVVSAIGGSPQLLQNGRPAYPTENRDSFTQERHPRTIVGLTRSGEVLLVTADGRGASQGLTLREATQLLRELGAVDAMNLDGGGSTTFVASGVVGNVPSDGRERPVASALAVVAGGPADPVTALLTEVIQALQGLLQQPPGQSTPARPAGPGWRS